MYLKLFQMAKHKQNSAMFPCTTWLALFLMRFGLVEDFENIIKGGPWFIEGHFLMIRAREPNFKPTSVVCNLVAVWIRLSELPFEYYDPRVLREIGSAIGPILRVDSNTELEARG